MKTLIVYATRHGCTAESAKRLAAKLKGESVLADLKRDPRTRPEEYDAVIVGGSIHAGRIQGRVRKFLQKHRQVLLNKKLGLFLCHMEQGEGAHKEFREAFPEEWRNRAAATGLFGGAFSLERMNWIERFIVGKVAKVKESVSKIDDAAIAAFAERWNTK